jgi:hypothetical protein
MYLIMCFNVIIFHSKLTVFIIPYLFKVTQNISRHFCQIFVTVNSFFLYQHASKSQRLLKYSKLRKCSRQCRIHVLTVTCAVVPKKNVLSLSNFSQEEMPVSQAETNKEYTNKNHAIINFVFWSCDGTGRNASVFKTSTQLSMHCNGCDRNVTKHS